MRAWRTTRAAVLVLAVCLPAWAGETGKDALSGSGKDRPRDPAPRQEPLEWVTYGEALERAAREDKHVLVDFYTSWCGWCKVMDKQTYADSGVVRVLNRHFVISRINAESPRKFPVGERQLSGSDLANEFGVRQFPMTWFLKPDGSKLANLPGFIPPERFVKALEYVRERRYAKDESSPKN